MKPAQNTPTDIKQFIETFVRYFDPVLVAGSGLDLYDQVAGATAARLPPHAARPTQSALEQGLLEIYGADWLLNPNVKKRPLLKLFVSRFTTLGQHHAPLPPAGPNSAWLNGRTCNFIGWRTTDNIEGTTRYIHTKTEHTIIFNPAHPVQRKTTRIQLPCELAIVIDDFGRLLYPAHYLNNLFLHNRPQATIQLPPHKPGSVYFEQPYFTDDNGIVYLDIATLTDPKVDHNAGIIQFGQKAGDDTFEVASGFVVSLTKGKLVGAWVKFDSTAEKLHTITYAPQG